MCIFPYSDHGPSISLHLLVTPAAGCDLLIEFLKGGACNLARGSRRKDYIIAALTERTPAIEASSEASEVPQTTSETAYKGDEAEAPPYPEQRSWLRRLFG
jgi:hypothetical protein